MMMKALFIAALALGAYAQNNRVRVVANCTLPQPLGGFPWCAKVDEGTANSVAVGWRLSPDGSEVDIVVGLRGRDNTFTGWCAWGLSDTQNMIDSSVIVFGADIVRTGAQANFDRQIGAARATPTVSPQAQQQQATLLAPQVAGDYWGTLIDRPTRVAGLPASRQFMGTVNMIVACGTQATFGARHDIQAAAFTLNVESGALVDPPAGTTAPPTPTGTDGGASHLQVASAVVIAVVGSMAVALF